MKVQSTRECAKNMVRLSKGHFLKRHGQYAIPVRTASWPAMRASNKAVVLPTPSLTKDAFVALVELVGTRVDVQLLLRTCYNLTVMRLCLLDQNHVKNSTMLLVTSPLFGPAVQPKIERCF